MSLIDSCTSHCKKFAVTCTGDAAIIIYLTHLTINQINVINLQCSPETALLIQIFPCR